MFGNIWSQRQNSSKSSSTKLSKKFDRVVFAMAPNTHMQNKLKVNEPTAATGIQVVPLSILATGEVALSALFEGLVKTEGVGVLAGSRAR